MNAIRSVDHTTTVEKAYAFIKEGILSLEFRPRERLGTQDLADRLRVSRTPIREALARLGQEGLVVRDGGWGYAVRGFSSSEVLNLYRVREILEVEAIEEVIQHLDERLISLLVSIMDESEEHFLRRQYSKFQSKNREFYALISQIMNNALLQQMLSTISDRIRIFGALVLEQNADRGRGILQENRRILEALKARDISEARKAVRDHIHQARDNVLRCFGKQLDQRTPV